MNALFEQDPLRRFTSRAANYERCRPDYPAEAVDWLVSRCQLTATSLVVDTGSGTGISTRQIASRGVRVIGIEPNDAMRTRAAAMEQPAGCAELVYLPGRAEATGLDAGVADLVLSAQAFHWFVPDTALAEFHRILRPHGWVCLMWYELDESDPATAAYAAVIRTAPDALHMESSRKNAGAALARSNRFADYEKRCFHHEQTLDREGLLGRAFSVSYAPKSTDEIAPWTAALHGVFDRHQSSGKITLRYETTLHLARAR